jgi:lysophospholipase L1-like esterase
MASEHILTIINLGINDWENAVSTTTFNTNMQAIITAAKLAGDVLLATPNTTNGTASIATQATYVAKIQTLATSNSVKLVDL